MKHPKQERTFVILKPDAVQRSLIGEIIKRYERVGLKLAGLKFIVPTAELVEKHYTIDPEWKRKVGEKRLAHAKENGIEADSKDALEIGNMVLTRLKKYMTAGPVIAMVWEGAHAVAIVRKLTGGTEPLGTDVGTIRGDFVLDSYAMSDHDDRSIRNLVHASGNVQEAESEINLWFQESDLVSYRLMQEQILYDVNIDGVFE